ncbi:hypothetical protein QCE73_37350 [Caballeronia sp. LZ029]|uniref:hypothetical protein n=1 Tax=Caballeronia sp. LZ029 TaxID=3038564 RepID=UPI002860EA00|nr:hypothetical protein [Caballeronia sp. LZ029]MDR5748849.1 hypothetical protein [Caballeronia sp. LZ029]
MPILQNLNALSLGTRLNNMPGLVLPPAAAAAATAPPTPAVMPPTPSAQTSATAAATVPLIDAAHLGLLPQLPQAPVTTLARGAIAQLNAAAAGILAEAVRTITNQRLTGDTLMDYLERKVRIGEVLGNRAAQWSDTTKADFAGQSGAFQMMPDQLDTMDSIVSIAILNDRSLEADIRGENTKETTPDDLLKNRRIVWQSPPAGTVLSPPYIVVIAVEYQDAAAGESVVSSITDQLGDYQGFKLPKSVIQKL